MSKLLTKEELYKNACIISKKAGLKLFTELKNKRLTIFPNYDNETYVCESISQDERLKKLGYTLVEKKEDYWCTNFFCYGKCSRCEGKSDFSYYWVKGNHKIKKSS